MRTLNTNIVLTIIKIFLAISICAFFTTYYGLQNEKKIEELNDKIDKLKSSNVDLNDWSLTFSGNLTDLTNYILIAKQKYYFEKNDFKYCVRLINVGKGLELFKWFFEKYKNVLDGDQIIRYKFHDKEKSFKFFDEKIENFKSSQCNLDKFKEDEEYLLKTVPVINDYQSDFLLIIQELRSSNFLVEQQYYEEIKEISNNSSIIYLSSFLIQIFLSIMIVFLDLYTNRGLHEK